MVSSRYAIVFVLAAFTLCLPSTSLLATASYRLLPHIIIHEPIPPHLIPKFKSCFAPGVIESRRNPATGSEEVIVANPRKDTMSREVLRHEEFQDIVQLTRIRDFFLCGSLFLSSYAE